MCGGGLRHACVGPEACVCVRACVCGVGACGTRACVRGVGGWVGGNEVGRL